MMLVSNRATPVLERAYVSTREEESYAFQDAVHWLVRGDLSSHRAQPLE